MGDDVGTAVAERETGAQWPWENVRRNGRVIEFSGQSGSARNEVRIVAGDSGLSAHAKDPDFYGITVRKLSEDLIVEVAYQRDLESRELRVRRTAEEHHHRGQSKTFDKYMAYIKQAGVSS